MLFLSQALRRTGKFVKRERGDEQKLKPTDILFHENRKKDSNRAEQLLHSHAHGLATC
jgi:hypothetical protein